MAKGRVDPITGALIAGAMTSICDEMAHKLMRMSYSSIIRESEDFGCALLDADGQQIAESMLSTPLQSGPIMGYVQGITEALAGYGEELFPGDVIMHNHAYFGASHGPDVAFCVPIFRQEQLVGYSVTTAHHLDIGALSPGSCGIVDATDAYAEGLQVKAVKVYEKGIRNTWVWRMLETNLRMSHVVLGDMEAQISAARTGAERFLTLVDEHGVDVIQDACADLMDYSERMMRQKIEQLPDGRYDAVGYLDGFSGHEDPGYSRLPIVVALTVAGSDIHIDLAGTADQVDLPINMPFKGTVDVAAYVVIRSILLDTAVEENVPANAGLYRPITIEAPLGCLANPRYPAPVIARFSPGNVLAGVIQRALASVIPERVSAGVGNLKVVAYSGLNPDGDYWVYMDITEGSYGGRSGKDGMDAVDTLYANTRNNPIEDLEAHYPLRVERYELREDVAGPGRWRGGVGSIRDVRMLVGGGFSIEGDGDLFAPEGLFGGMDGATGATILDLGLVGGRLPLPAMSAYRKANEGVLLRTVSPCGGGYGDPLERDPARVLEDVLDELVSLESARSSYGVVIDASVMTVDDLATKMLRASRLEIGSQSARNDYYPAKKALR